MIVKKITIECLECGYFDEADDSSDEYEELYNLDHCPGCIKKVAEEI